MKRKYFHQLLIAIDQLLNTLLAGWADETLSSRAYRTRHKKRWYIAMHIIDGIFFWQDQHCKQSYLVELYRGHKPEDFFKEIR